MGPDAHLFHFGCRAGGKFRYSKLVEGVILVRFDPFREREGNAGEGERVLCLGSCAEIANGTGSVKVRERGLVPAAPPHLHRATGDLGAGDK